MITAKIDPRGLAELRRLAGQVEKVGRDLPRLGSAEILASLQSETDRFARTGRLKRSFRVETSGNQARVVTRAPYAQIQDRGGVIRPRSAPWLRVAAALREIRLVRSVRIPAKHWLERAANRAEARVEKVAFNALEAAVSK
jgi:phage gpG-like protein